jgi:hypothetical protein
VIDGLKGLADIVNIAEARSLSEKAPIECTIVAVGQLKADNGSSLGGRLLSRRPTEIDDE